MKEPFSYPHQTGDDFEGDAIRSNLLKSLGALKATQTKDGVASGGILTGGLASQLFNSKQILDLAAEEGLSIPSHLQSRSGDLGIISSQPSAFASFASSAFEPHVETDKHSASFDSLGNLALQNSASGGQGQSNGHHQSHHDGQSTSQQANPQISDVSGLDEIVSGNDEILQPLHALKNTDENYFSGQDGHQTTLSAEHENFDISPFSTAPTRTSALGALSSGGSSGAREMLMSVTYAMSGRSSSTAGSALSAEMRFMSLGQQVMAALKQNSQEIELRLNPVQLGNVVLKLHVEGQKISISAQTESQLSDDALTLGEDGLRASLAAHGYHLDKFDVSHKEERRKSNRSEADQPKGTDSASDDPFSFDLIA